MTNTINKEAVAEIRNSNLCMAGIIRKFIKKLINGEQALIMITKELKRQGEYLKILENGGI